jgi:hypothetical protein
MAYIEGYKSAKDMPEDVFELIWSDFVKIMEGRPVNNKLKQAQLNHDNQLPPDTTEQDELIQTLAEELIEYGVVFHLDDMVSCIHLDDLEVWMKNAEYKSIRIQSKINLYKELQLELCKCMMNELIKNEGE